MNMTTKVGISQDDVMAVLRRCYDPCCKERQVSVVDMGLIERVEVEGSQVAIDMILTTGWCPFAVHLLQMMEEEVKALPGIEQVQVNITWDTPWSPERMSALARERLRLPLEQLLPLREARIRATQKEGGND